jgi:cytochrome c551/c552
MLRTALCLAIPLLLHAQGETQALAILRKNCVSCHSEQAKMGGLVLETLAGAMRGGISGSPGIVPSAAARSAIVEKINGNKMPPGNPLPAADREILTKWIDAGAPWSAAIAQQERKRGGPDHWSLQPLRQGLNSSIDHHIQAALRAKGLTSNPPADARTLIRRATFDLTGLPPTPEEIEAFLRDRGAGAYERLIDRLLASPAYGERWGRHWMDVIRFGESHGYEQNHLRPNAWPFRDYVIQSFNEDKPFDRMILEHLAGDVIAPEDPKVFAGAAFLVAGPHDTVGNENEAAKRQQRADDLDDMINATSQAFLGLTVGCARCHDHKFDPIQQRDYYRMAAVLNGVQHGEREFANPAEIARDRAVRDPLLREQQLLNERLAAIRKDAEPAIAAQRDAILAKFRPAVDSRFTEERFTPVAAKAVRLQVRRTASGGAAGLEELEVWSGEVNVARSARITATSTRKADDDPEAYSARLLNDGKFDRRWFAETGAPVTLTVELDSTVTIDRVSWSRDRAGGFQGRFEGSPIADYAIEVADGSGGWIAVASSEGRLPARAEQREEMLLLAVVSPEIRAEYESLESRRAALQKQIAELPKLPAIYAGKTAQPKEPVYLLRGGNAMNRGDAIVPASLSTLPFATFKVDEAQPEGERRVALARWLGDPRNPLTPRVLANRIWHYHFGRGLVGTPSDFGFNGDRPTHPELLDVLASKLIAGGWRLKPLHREILLSAAYRQSSAFDAAKARVDADATMLWRFPPQRLSAEAIRDSILAVSGKLDRRMGGPGFHLFRYTVDNVATYFPIEEFGPETFRRAVYQTAARSVRSELLGEYDCPDSSLPEPKRIVTTSPLQALALLNNDFALDQARYFAERLHGEGADPVTRAFELAFGRPPEAAEKEAALALIRARGLAAFCRAILNANEFVYAM